MTRRPHHDLDAAIEWLVVHPNHYLFPAEPLASTDPGTGRAEHRPKSPRLSGYLEGKSTNSAEQLRGWWTDWWGYNRHLEPMWGISRTQSNLIFVDVDEKPDADPPKTGMATFDWLDVLHGWPPTLETTSPSGGRHLFYDASEFGSFMHIGKPDGPHPYVDFAQHVLVPGCGGYALTRDLSIAPAPEWLYQFKAGTKYASAGSGRSGWASAAGRPRQRPLGGRLNNPANVAHMTHWLLNDAPLAISGQCGDETTYQVVAGHLKDWGIGQRMSWRLMRDNWNKRCTPPWTDQGLWAKVCSAWRSLRENRPGELSAEAQFPDDAHEYTAGPEAPAARARRLKVASFARAAKKGHVTRTPVLGCQGGRPYVATGRTKVVDGVRVPVVREIVEE